jgi:hypothetical protein
VSNETDLDRPYTQLQAERGWIEVLVANAGLLEQRKLCEITRDNFDKTFDTNARGTFFTAQKALRLMRDGGSIIRVSSIAWFKGRPAHGVYSATKAAIRPYACPSDIDPMDFSPFNLIAIDLDAATFRSNRPTSTRQVLAPEVYGPSNGELNEPWPKTVRLKSVLLDWVAAGAQQPELLLSGLRDDTIPEIGERSDVTSDVPQEAPISPIFIKSRSKKLLSRRNRL